jgi:hypothetical protein
VGRRLTIALLPLALLAAGCGGGSKSNGEAKKPALRVVQDAQKAALGATAVHVTGHVVDSGTMLQLDLHLAKGKGKGSMSEKGLRFDIVRVGDKVYLRGSDAFWRKFAGATLALLLHGKWVVSSASQGQLAALAPLTDEGQLFKSALGSHGTLKNQGETTYQGMKAVAIKDTTQGGTLYVAATGPPYPIALKGGKDQGSISFDSWNEVVSFTAPKGALDLSKYGG